MKKEFKITDSLKVVCESKPNKIGFKHCAKLYDSKRGLLKTTSIQYFNRTWESYEFESVLRKLLEKSEGIISDNERKEFKKVIEKSTDDLFELKMVRKIWKMYDILNYKNTPDQKAKILKDLLGDQIIIPDNWKDLPEKEKEKRIKRIEKFLGELQ